MTRHPIPFEKNLKLNRINTFRQTGIIAFKKDKLLKFSKLKQHYNEAYESIDMLKLLRMVILYKHTKHLSACWELIL